MIDKKIEFTASAPTWIRESRWQKMEYLTNAKTGETYRMKEDYYICVLCHGVSKKQFERCPWCKRSMNTAEEWEEYCRKVEPKWRK